MWFYTRSSQLLFPTPDNFRHELNHEYNHDLINSLNPYLINQVTHFLTHTDLHPCGFLFVYLFQPAIIHNRMKTFIELRVLLRHDERVIMR